MIIFSSHKHMGKLIKELGLQAYKPHKRGKWFYQYMEDNVAVVEKDSKPFGPMDSYDFNSLVNKVSIF